MDDTALRGLEMDDLEAFHAMLEGEGGIAHDRERDLPPMSVDDCERMLRSLAGGDGLALTSGDELRGVLWTKDFSRRHSRARMVLVHDDATTSIIASWATLAWEHLRDAYNLHRLTSIVPTGSVLEAGLREAGFVTEGTLVGDHFHDGRFRDSAIMSIVRGEWP